MLRTVVSLLFVCFFAAMPPESSVAEQPNIVHVRGPQLNLAEGKREPSVVEVRAAWERRDKRRC
jgi:hypothetical protein